MSVRSAGFFALRQSEWHDDSQSASLATQSKSELAAMSVAALHRYAPAVSAVSMLRDDGRGGLAPAVMTRATLRGQRRAKERANFVS